MLTNNLARWTLFSFIACRELAEKGIQRRHMKAKSTKNMQMLKVRTFHQEFILEASSSQLFPPITAAAEHYDCM